jgi:hypothetical protein
MEMADTIRKVGGERYHEHGDRERARERGKKLALTRATGG